MVCATRAVSSGMAGIGCGCNDICFLLGALTISLLSVSHILTFASLRIRQQYLNVVVLDDQERYAEGIPSLSISCSLHHSIGGDARDHHSHGHRSPAR